MMNNQTNEQTGRATTIKATPLVRGKNSPSPRTPAGKSPPETELKPGDQMYGLTVIAASDGAVGDASVQTDRKNEDRMLGCVRRSGTPPEIPARSYVHPSVADIAALEPDQWFEVQRGTVKLDTLKRRVREANTKNKQRGGTAHCACFAQEDGTMIVRRVDPQAKGT